MRVLIYLEDVVEARGCGRVLVLGGLGHNDAHRDVEKGACCRAVGVMPGNLGGISIMHF
jgi:hypothetical protein